MSAGTHEHQRGVADGQKAPVLLPAFTVADAFQQIRVVELFPAQFKADHDQLTGLNGGIIRPDFRKNTAFVQNVRAEPNCLLFIAGETAQRAEHQLVALDERL